MEERKTEANGTDSESSIPVEGKSQKSTPINNLNFSTSEKDVVLKPNYNHDNTDDSTSTPSSELPHDNAGSQVSAPSSAIPSDLQLTNAASTPTSASEKHTESTQQKTRTENARGIQFADENGGVLYETIYASNLHYAKQQDDESEAIRNPGETNRCHCCIVS